MSNALRTVREKRLLTRAELALATRSNGGGGVSVSTIQRLETGGDYALKSTIRSLAAALEVSPQDLGLRM
jgi:transcriptional regulator with XRE-family HTH domain